MIVTIILFSIIWLAIHFGSGYLAYLLPITAVAKLPLVNHSYRWEDQGRVYARLGIRVWKGRLPEGGDFYQGGFSKRHLQNASPEHLQRFSLETARAEFSHWLTWALAFTFFAWTPWPVGVAMLVYGAIVNLPCILIQRYNRARLQRAMQGLARRSHRHGAPFPMHTLAHQGAVKRSG